MRRGSHPSFPASNDRSLRHLVGGKTGASGSLRAQMVVVAMLGLLLLTVPLYLLRRPHGSNTPPASDTLKPAFGGVVRPPEDAGAAQAAVSLGPIQRAKCSAAPSLRGNEGALCDSIPLLEDALRNTIAGSPQCAPKTGKEGTINFVLEVDFPHSRINVFPGKSGMWKGPQARRATGCILRGFPTVPWSEITHRYRYYMIAILATYPAPDPLDILPTFE